MDDPLGLAFSGTSDAFTALPPRTASAPGWTRWAKLTEVFDSFLGM